MSNPNCYDMLQRIDKDDGIKYGQLVHDAYACSDYLNIPYKCQFMDILILRDMVTVDDDTEKCHLTLRGERLLEKLKKLEDKLEYMGLGLYQLQETIKSEPWRDDINEV